ncbi:hypothetical protein AXG93_2587s1010 [Marchantia polymorpha subsp. ruderalis]|uniref:Uncharacterized protein n=1 Tax=Marchantia polymorpha subsp. ruderalis TaxID=1480154 RepID=A0A176WSV4_MARPO|nr:hypothetical protein AXG93_2587s1010 [Marchantia polymorpha subsp. ruderalis]
MREMSEVGSSVGGGGEQAVDSSSSSSEGEGEYATELHFAVKENDVTTIRKLIERGAKVNSPDRFGRSPLHWAIVYGHQEATKALILNTSKRALDSTDSCGCTALHYAALGGRTEIGRILIDRGAQVNCADSRQRTPLHFAAQHPQPTMVEMLISRGADKRCRDFREYLPCDVALEWASFSSLACLRPDAPKKDPKLKVHPVEIVDCPDARAAAVDVVQRKGPSLDKLLESWKSAETEARRKKEAESQVAARSFADLQQRLQEWRAAELDARQAHRADSSRPSFVDDWGNDAFSSSPSPASSSALPSSSSHPASSSSPFHDQTTAMSQDSCSDESPSYASSSRSSGQGDATSLAGVPDWLMAADCRSSSSNSNSSSSGRKGLKEALLWCTEWEVEHPHPRRASQSEQLSHDDDAQNQSPPKSPRERKGKAKAFSEEEPQLEEAERNVCAFSTFITSCIMKEMFADDGMVADLPQLQSKTASISDLEGLQRKFTKLAVDCW